MAKPKIEVRRTFQRGARLVESLPHTGDMPLAGAFVDPNISKEHVLLSGRTGAGKTQVLLPLLDYITNKVQRTNNTIAIVTDISGEFTSKFYNPETDYILNPFDERSQKWNPFSEIEDASDCAMLAEALVERSGDSQARQWEMFAERIIADSLNALHYTADFKLKDQIQILFRILGFQEPEFAAEVLKGTQSEGYFKKEMRHFWDLLVKLLLDPFVDLRHLNRQEISVLENGLRTQLTERKKKSSLDSIHAERSTGA